MDAPIKSGRDNLMKLHDLTGAGRSDIDIAGLTADSRSVRPGFLFAALAGAKSDGARYIADAVGKGAAAILLDERADAPTANGVPLIRSEDPRRTLALMAAKFHAPQPSTVVAVTGTNGKTSVAAFVRQVWENLRRNAASIGTVGVVSPSGVETLSHTTPDPVELHQILARLASCGTQHVALEASSHGLQQRRLDGVRLAAAAFTNLSRDHMDYHAGTEDYFQQKLRLFTTLLPDGAAAVVDADEPYAERVADAAAARRLPIFSVGRAGMALTLLSVERDGFAQRLRVRYQDGTYDIRLKLVGDFQTSNALVAAALCIAAGEDAASVLAALDDITGARGRLDFAGETPEGAPIFVDYAHTPDALAKALNALRPYAENRLAVVFGCGGDRDRGKRPQMGGAAVAGADIVYVTDDNPRSEDPAEIRRAILAEAPGAIEIGNRAEAIATAVGSLKAGDVLLVAGKGHETGQIIGSTTVPFSDHDAVASALRGVSAA